MASVGVARNANPGVEEPGENVGEEIHDHDEKPEEEGDSEKKELVAGGGGVYEVLAHTRHLKDGLHDEGTADQGGESRPEVGYGGDETTAKGVFDDDLGRRQALG
jgi:hypothetical protein